MSQGRHIRPGAARQGMAWAVGLAVLFVAMWAFVERSVWLGLWGLTNDLDGISPFYAADLPLVTWMMFLHMVTGGALTLLAPLQMVGPLRRRWPRVHRWCGRTMIALGVITGAGGLLYALGHGTTGGPFMDASSTLYGVLVLLASVQTLRLGLRRSWAAHRRWGIRLTVLVVASWLYRVHYMLWERAFGDLWITPDMTGPFDKVQAWGFYLFYLILLEAWFVVVEDRPRRRARSLRSVRAAEPDERGCVP